MEGISGRFLVRGSSSSPLSSAPVLATTVPLSLWGGLDPLDATVVDTQHPLHGHSIAGHVWALPSGRGSCTASQVLLELIRNGKSPAAIVLKQTDALLCVGALVAQYMLEDVQIPYIWRADNPDEFDALVEKLSKKNLDDSTSVRMTFAPGGRLLCFDSTDKECSRKAQQQEETAISKEGDVNDDSNLVLTDEESAYLSYATSEAERQALQVLFRYARITTDPPSYVPVESGHVDACTYIGPGGLEFVQRLVKGNGKVKIPTTLNSMSTDPRRWQQLGLPADRALPSMELADAYVALGCQPTFTCAPYLLVDKPSEKKNWVWGESNAVVYANSIWGVRTNKTADYLDICAAVAGIVPADGMYASENRRPTKEIRLEGVEWDTFFPTAEDAHMATLGHLCGTISDGQVPILVGLEKWKDTLTDDHWKAFCAAFGTTGASPLIHIAGISPEATSSSVLKDWKEAISDSASLSFEAWQQTWKKLDSNENQSSKVDLIALGNPHLSVSECNKLAQLVDDKQDKHPEVDIVACLSREVQSKATDSVAKMEGFGVKIVNDTCWCMLLEAPVIPPDPQATILTNSGKYAHYGPGLVYRRFRFGSMAQCIESARTGVFHGRRFQHTSSHSTIANGRRAINSIARGVFKLR